MISIADGIQRVQSIYSKGVQSKDTRLTRRHIYAGLTAGRAALLQQKSNKNQSLSAWAYQTIYIELEKVKGPLSCIPNSKTLLRSKYKIPTIVNDMDGEMIESITTPEGKTIGKTSAADSPYKAFSKYTLPSLRGVVDNSYLYITGNDMLKMAVMRAVFQDPIEVYQFPNPCDDCDQCKCKDITEIEFPIDAAGLDVVADMAIQKLIGVFIQMTEDRESNAADDAGGKTMLHQPQQQQA